MHGGWHCVEIAPIAVEQGQSIFYTRHSTLILPVSREGSSCLSESLFLFCSFRFVNKLMLNPHTHTFLIHFATFASCFHPLSTASSCSSPLSGPLYPFSPSKKFIYQHQPPAIRDERIDDERLGSSELLLAESHSLFSIPNSTQSTLKFSKISFAHL